MARPGPIDPSNPLDCTCPVPNVTHEAHCRWAQRERREWADSIADIYVDELRRRGLVSDGAR